MMTNIVVITFLIILIIKVSSAILLANLGLLVGGFALTNIDKVKLISSLSLNGEVDYRV